MPKTFLAAVALLTVTNIVVLAGVAYNRSGEPVAGIVLSERELPLQRPFGINRENSATSLALKWRVLYRDELPDYLYTTRATPAWLDDEKLTGLGFDIKEIKSNLEKYRYNTNHLVTETVLVLEFHGETHQRAIESARRKAARLDQEADRNPDIKNLSDRYENFQKQLRQLEESHTRLYVVDAGLDEQALIEKYAKNGNYLLARGLIGLQWDDDTVEGYIKKLSIDQVHVPLPLSEPFMKLSADDSYPYKGRASQPRYTVQLNIGNRLEPWIESIEMMGN